MVRIPLFSQRKSKQAKTALEYERMPKPFRVQVIHIIRAAIPPNAVADDSFNWGDIKNVWNLLFSVITKELGVFHLTDPQSPPSLQIFEYLLKCDDIEFLDITEIVFKVINRYVRDRRIANAEQTPDGAIQELNERFQQYSLGYKFIDELIRVDTEFLQAEAVEPAIQLLRNESFIGAEEEFFKAHKHFRTGHYDESIIFANRAFESTLKTICEKRNWKYDKNASAKKLISVVLEKGLLPKFMDMQLNQVQSLLESGIPTIRNKLGGHGQGEEVREVPEHMASYALNLTATTIVMLMHSFMDKRKRS